MGGFVEVCPFAPGRDNKAFSKARSLARAVGMRDVEPIQPVEGVTSPARDAERIEDKTLWPCSALWRAVTA